MMTDSPTTEANVEDSSGAQEETGGSLRAKLEQALAENRAYKAKELEAAFDEIGLDPNRGLGKAIAKEYSGPPTAEALGEFAKAEYDHEKPAPEPVADPPIAQQVTEAQQALDAAAETAGSVPIVPSEADELAAAEAAGDYQKTLDIKSRMIEAQLKGR